MYYEDITKFEYFGNIDDIPIDIQKINPIVHKKLMDHYNNSLNIGWLDENHDYEKGETPPNFLSILKKKEMNIFTFGSHCCPFCKNHHGGGVYEIKGKGKTYYTLEMIIHYIEKHNYKPPQEFIDSVLALKRRGLFLNKY